MSKKYEWKRDQFAGWLCEMPNNITLVASPCRTASRGFTVRAANGTDWRAQCSIWDETTRTLSRYGRDAWQERPADAKTAKRLAEEIYESELSLSLQ